MSESIAIADADGRRRLKAELARFNCQVHQADDPPLFTREPEPQVQTVLWRWRDIEPLLARLAGEISLDVGGPRRTLRLHNPGLAYGTTNTFWASIQVILPGEVASAHRHSANALRFIMRGGGATTTVDGRRYPMDEGALVLTPAWSWHDHVHHGDEPMIWLDVLDISLMRSLQASFFEPYRTREQAVADRPQQTSAPSGRELMGRPQLPTPAARGANPLFVYDAAAARSALREAAEFEPDPFDDIVLEYRNPADGGPAMRTLGTRLQQLRRGVRRKARRHTGSKLYYVVQGIGATIVAGETYEWSQGDFLTVAPWAWHEHLNRSDEEDAVLFQVNDIPSMQALGYFREEALTSNGGHQTLADRR